MDMDMDTPKKISAPRELDKAFFANALKNALHELLIDVRRIKFLWESSDEEKHNCSQNYRVFLVYAVHGRFNPDTISVMVKVTPTHEGLDLLESIRVFNKEKWLLMEIMPQFEILLNDIKFSPRCYHATNSPFQALVLEDMDRFGYQIGVMNYGLDERHTKFALKKLAQFHAVSMVFARRRPTMMAHYNRGLLDPKVINPATSLYKLLHKHLKYVIKSTSTWEGYEEITQKLQEFDNDLESRILTCEKHSVGDIKVLNHGDLWLNNLLFKYDPRNNPVDVVFMDFQMSIYGSLGIDLNYFLFASVQLEALEKWKMLLEVYHASLRDTLTELSYSKIPTYADIEKELKRKSTYGFLALIGPLPNLYIEGNTFEKLAGSIFYTKALFVCPAFIERLKYSLLELDKMGAFTIP